MDKLIMSNFNDIFKVNVLSELDFIEGELRDLRMERINKNVVLNLINNELNKLEGDSIIISDIESIYYNIVNIIVFSKIKRICGGIIDLIDGIEHVEYNDD